MGNKRLAKKGVVHGVRDPAAKFDPKLTRTNDGREILLWATTCVRAYYYSQSRLSIVVVDFFRTPHPYVNQWLDTPVLGPFLTQSSKIRSPDKKKWDIIKNRDFCPESRLLVES